jgi:dolichol-phosphate mannosyltransferase
MRFLVIIPTYNERENIRELVPAILKEAPDVDILVVDDGSPDGTGQQVLELKNSGLPVNLLPRTKKEGLGRAYVAGFKWARERGYEVVIEMDADFSHRPVDLKKIIDQSAAPDFIVGSRYCAGGGVTQWGLGRRLLSRGGSLYARTILGLPLNDWTGGFNLWKMKTLEGIGIDSLASDGYAFQIELKFRALKRGFRGIEVPILFDERRAGQSKMSSRIVLEALGRVWSIRLSGGQSPGKSGVQSGDQ